MDNLQTAAISPDESKRPSTRPSSTLALGITSLASILIVIALVGLIIVRPYSISPTAYLAIILTFIATLSVRGKILQTRDNVALRKLNALDDPTEVGTLLELAAGDHPGFVADALRRLLPRFAVQPGAALTPRQHDYLYGLLIRTGDCDLAVATFEAYEHIGPTSAIWWVRNVAERMMAGLTRADVVEAARRCLVQLEARAAREQCAERLLRAAENPTAVQPLLRPIDSARHEDEEYLLRPLRMVPSDISSERQP